jgi:hypothetical protein
MSQLPMEDIIEIKLVFWFVGIILRNTWKEIDSL